MKKNKIGLALSGGGQRAAAFHLGVLKKLNDHGILNKIKAISSVSGGSIIAAYYMLHKNNFESFCENFLKKLKVNIELHILLSRDFFWKVICVVLLLSAMVYYYFSFHNYIFLILLIPLLIILKYSLVIFPSGRSLQRVYDKLFFERKVLTDLADDPVLIFNSTNLQTGTLMTFSKKSIFDATYWFRNNYVPKFFPEKIPISFVVAASSSFAPFISPIRFQKEQMEISEAITEKNIKPELADGGIYDNQGIYRLNEENVKIIICSDASSPYDRDKYSAINPFGLLMRTINTLMKRIRAFQYSDELYNRPDIYEIAYFSIDWEYEKCLDNFAKNALNNKIKQNVLDEHKLDPRSLPYSVVKDPDVKKAMIREYMRKQIDFINITEGCLNTTEIKEISKISTRLRGLNDKEIEKLIKHGETLADIQLRLYCPSLFKTTL